MYRYEYHALEELKDHVRKEIRAIDKGLLQAVMVISGHCYGNVLFEGRTMKELQFLKINPLNAELNPICHLLALLGAHHILHISVVRVKELTLSA